MTLLGHYRTTDRFKQAWPLVSNMLVTAFILLISLYGLWRLLSVFQQKNAPQWSPDGQRIIITGASSGIGKALALHFTAKGAAGIVIAARRRDELERVAEECGRVHATRTKIVLAVGDAGDRRFCKEVVELCNSELGGVDCVVANAGVSHSGFFKDASEEDLDLIEKIVQVNTMQCFYLAHYALPYLSADTAANGSEKKLCFISSVAGLVGAPGRVAYSASKFAVNGMAEALRIELKCLDKQQRVGVTVICPGPVQTDINRTRVAFGGGQPIDIPFPPGTLTAAQAAAKIERALSGGIAIDVWMKSVLLAPFLRAFAPGLFERVLLKGTQQLLGKSGPGHSKHS